MWRACETELPPEDGTYPVLMEKGGPVLRQYRKESGWQCKAPVRFWTRLPSRPEPDPDTGKDSPYLNHDNREIAGSVAACEGYMLSLCEKTFRRSALAKPYLEEAAQAAAAAFDVITGDIDRTQMQALVKLMKESELKIVPRNNPESGRIRITVDTEKLLILAAMAAEQNGCSWCEKNRHEVKQCELRKLFFELDITAGKEVAKGECQYTGLL